jgi:hypothetical protein
MPAEDILYEELMYAFETYDNYVAKIEAQKTPIITSTISEDGSITESVDYISEGKVGEGLKTFGNKILKGLKWILDRVVGFFQNIGSWIKKKIHRTKVPSNAELVAINKMLDMEMEEINKMIGDSSNTIDSAVKERMSRNMEILKGKSDTAPTSTDHVSGASAEELASAKAIVEAIKDPNTDFIKLLRGAKTITNGLHRRVETYADPAKPKGALRSGIIPSLVVVSVTTGHLKIKDMFDNTKVKAAIVETIKDVTGAKIQDIKKKHGTYYLQMVIGDFSNTNIPAASVNMLSALNNDHYYLDQLDRIFRSLGGAKYSDELAKNLTIERLIPAAKSSGGLSMLGAPYVKDVVFFPTSKDSFIRNGVMTTKDGNQYPLSNGPIINAYFYNEGSRNKVSLFVERLRDIIVEAEEYLNVLVNRDDASDERTRAETLLKQFTTGTAVSVKKICQDFMSISTTLAESTWEFEM